MTCCSSCSFSSRLFFSVSVNHFAFLGLSSIICHQIKAQTKAGAPSKINIQRHPIDFTRYPDNIDIQRMVAGLPKIKNVFALDRSDFVNHLLKKISIDGITALSTTPSIKRMEIKKFTLLTMPVAIASAPHKINDQKINFFALLFEAYNAPGIWKKKYPRKNNDPNSEDMDAVIFKYFAI